ncbi:MAG TPA: DUF5606 domain-containing protein [Flavisolibacter sp.]|jgi:hypothetical protein
MEYNRIVAVTGLPGLYEVISSKTDGALIRSLEDKSTRFVSSRIHNLSHLESIEIYTVRDNVPLSEIFTSMKNNGGDLPDVKDAKALRAYFEKAYPDMDFERVYGSDMKKMVNWFKMLEQHGVDYSASTQEEEGATEEEGTTSEEGATEEAAPEVQEVTASGDEPEAETAAKPKRTRKKKSEE